jgi:hypothetical protein
LSCGDKAGRCKKVYEKKPRTPYGRLMESPDVSPEYKAELQRRKTIYNPVELNRCLNKAVMRHFLEKRCKKLYENK